MPPLRTAEIKSRPSRKRFIFVRCSSSLFKETDQIYKKKKEEKKMKEEVTNK